MFYHMEHVLTHVPSKLPSLLTSSLNSSTGLRAYGSGPLLRKRGLYNMYSWNLGEKGSAQFSHCAMISANHVSCNSHSASHQSGSPAAGSSICFRASGFSSGLNEEE